MKEYMDKKAGSGIGFSRRDSKLAFRDPNHGDGSIQCCNRLGCSTRFHAMKGTQISNLEKGKYPKASFRSMGLNTLSGSSSKSLDASSDCRKPHQERRNRTSLQEVANVESSKRQGKTGDLETSKRRGDMVRSDTEDVESTTLHAFSENVTETVKNSDTKSSSRTQKQINQQWEPGDRDTSSGLSTRHSVASRNTRTTNKHASQDAGSGKQRYGLRNVSCTLVSGALPSGCSSSDSGRKRRIDVVTKRSSDGGSSSTRGKSMSASSNGGYLGSRHRGPSALSLSLPERLMSRQVSGKARNRPTSRAAAVIPRTPQGPGGQTRIRLSEQDDDGSRSLSVPIETSSLPQTQFSFSVADPESPARSLLVELPSIPQSTFGPQGSSSQTSDLNPGIFHSPFGDRDDYRHLNMEGITEVLLALDRFEQNEELTYEQLLVLETNFSFGLAFYDQHRGMRLDIDNMSYEELLALEDKMGTVSTALTEEALSRCLKRSVYMPVSLVSGTTGCGDDDTKCSICQEEYAVGAEVGKLACGHRYHVGCIHQWLRQKNWCPICKASACTS